MQVENIGCPRMQNISWSIRYFIAQKLNNKQSVKEFVGLIDLHHHTARDTKAI